jgi:hypothetical protein
MNDPATPNGYCLPSGLIVSLPAHCVDPIERFQIKDGSLVWAVRVDNDDEAAAHNLARRLPAPPRAR